MAIRLKKYLKNWLVYWEKIGSTPVGQGKYAAPQGRRCRWDDGAVQMVYPDQRLVVFQSRIILDQNVLEGSLVIQAPQAVTDAVLTPELKAAAALAWVKDTLKIQYPAVPTVKEGVREAKFIRRTGDIKARAFLTEIFLS